MPEDDIRQIEATVVSVQDITWMASEVIVLLILISALDGCEWFHAPAVLPPRENPGTHWTGDWVGLCAGLHGRDIRYIINLIPFFSVAQQPYSGVGRLTVEVSRSCTIRNTYPVGLLWSSNQFVVEAAAYTTHSKQKDEHLYPQRVSIQAIERLHSYALHSAATRIGVIRVINKETTLCSLNFFHTNSCTFSLNYVSVF